MTDAEVVIVYVDGDNYIPGKFEMGHFDALKFMAVFCEMFRKMRGKRLWLLPWSMPQL